MAVTGVCDAVDCGAADVADGRLVADAGWTVVVGPAPLGALPCEQPTTAAIVAAAIAATKLACLFTV